MLLPASTQGGRGRLGPCLNNLKQINIAFIMYAADNAGKFPMDFTATNGNMIKSVGNGNVSPIIQKLSPYFGRNPAILICPSDVDRQATNTFEQLTDLNISYFIHADALANNSKFSILAGDRNLEAANQPVKPGLFILTTNVYMWWTDSLHKRRGCLGFADGHAQLVGTNLNSIIQNQPLAINRLCVP